MTIMTRMTKMLMITRLTEAYRTAGILRVKEIESTHRARIVPKRI